VKRYMEYLSQYVKKLQQFERASSQLITVEQGKEPKEFWGLFFGERPVPASGELYGPMGEYNLLLKDVSVVELIF
jgi:hypothetical protein